MPKVYVTTSWDDGHIFDMNLAVLLRKYHLKGTFYIAPKNRNIPTQHRLSDEQIKELSREFEIGAHTMTHPDMLKIDDNSAEDEIRESKSYLENVIGRSVTSFCYPSGEYDKRHVRMVRDMQFAVARTVRRFSFSFRADRYQLPTSVHAYNHWSDAWQIALFSRFNPFLFIKYYRHWDDLAIAMYDHVAKNGGVFHLWGHSWEVDQNNDWKRLELVFRCISGKNDVFYVSNKEVV